MIDLENRHGDWIQTYTGRPFWPASARMGDISITDIAHALSNQCRFAGHCRRFYSVAEHSVLVSRVVPPEDALHGLLHDATEAYLIDVPRPVKPMLKGYVELEGSIWFMIARRFGIDPAMPVSVKEADNTVLLAERNALLGPTPDVPGAWAWADGLVPASVEILGWSPEKARAQFMDRFAELITEGHFRP